MTDKEKFLMELIKTITGQYASFFHHAWKMLCEYNEGCQWNGSTTVKQVATTNDEYVREAYDYSQELDKEMHAFVDKCLLACTENGFGYFLDYLYKDLCDNYTRNQTDFILKLKEDLDKNKKEEKKDDQRN